MISTLTVSNITKKYGKQTILHDISFELIDHEIIALLGDSGCGKSTLLRIIAGLETDHTGTIKLADQDITNQPPEKRDIGLFFQDYALFPHLNVMKNICYGLHKLKREERKLRAQEVMQLTKLEGLEKRYPHQLSGGQQQRVALARALAPSPSLLLLDEPFSNLDTTLKQQIRNELKVILKEASTPAIIVTHDMDDASVVADRIIKLSSGQIISDNATN